eukprot:14927779-Alexandrium_andersonii.AAC.1
MARGDLVSCRKQVGRSAICPARRARMVCQSPKTPAALRAFQASAFTQFSSERMMQKGDAFECASARLMISSASVRVAM